MMSTEKLLMHLENLVGFNPKTHDQIAVKKLLDYCTEVIEKSGHFLDIQRHTEKGFHSLTASTRGTKTPTVLLQAHIDVVPAPESLQYRVIGDEIVGRGVYDMLFAAAFYLTFIEEHKDELNKYDIGIMLTGDEEIGGFNGVEFLLNTGYGAEVCVLPDAGMGDGDLTIAAKGVYGFDLIAHGIAHHSARPWEGDGAGNKLIHMLHEVIGEFDMSERSNSTVTISRLSGGDADNKGPSEVAAHVDIRYKDQSDLKRIRDVVDEICKNYGGSIDKIDYGADYQTGTNKYTDELAKIYKKHSGKEMTYSKAHGSSDARFFSERGIPVIMMRPMGKGAHSDYESISISSLGKFYILLEEFTLKTAKIKSDE